MASMLGEREYVLRAESKKERDEWLRQLSDRMERVDEQADCQVRFEGSANLRSVGDLPTPCCAMPGTNLRCGGASGHYDPRKLRVLHHDGSGTLCYVLLSHHDVRADIAVQIHPEEGTGLFHLFEGVDYFFTIFFA
eukprot:687298-Rhodomonas_salina.1